MTDTPDSERTRVQTYVPAYQKDVWQEHADELGMTQSEFVRTMVQAGRRGFLSGKPGQKDGDSGGASSASNPQGTGIENTVVETLSNEGALDWDQLLARLTADVEDRLDEALSELQGENRVQYSGRDGGYVLTDE
ncbi:hypothetical protein C2R22_09910 [Salinigranum rubrum]|uniref:Uncharacterized protein n=1 Tax=Salinigranum rubrum TaxID=755307 RepID=A0A2I8VPU4_9EURY|nr:DUF5805 domain-containing protein [Salinigranum rubrum]AUV83947.1 hypothetical protein C2R22_09910 [Salinigranum rubrum]